ncbi:MAG: hypothetical protein GMKNLPBB_03115 [Myxococcota bacterium]|nr:hypothetical protein [Myxococcota bacterium]
MGTPVFIDYPRVDEVLLQHALARQPDSILVARDAVWDCAVPGSARIVPDFKSPEFRDEYIDDLQRWFSLLREKIRPSSLYHRAGVDLFEAVLYNYLFTTEEYVYRSWLVNRKLATENGSSGLRVIVDAQRVGHWFVPELIEKHAGTILEIGPGTEKQGASTPRHRFMKELIYPVFRDIRKIKSFVPRRDIVKPDILFVESYPNSIFMGAATCQELEKSFGIIARILVCHEKNWMLIRDSAQARYCIFLGDLISPDIQMGALFKKGVAASFFELAAEKILADAWRRANGYPINLCRKHRTAMVNVFTEAAGWIELASRILEELRPQVLCSHNFSNLFSRAFVLTAKSRAVPTVLFQHGQFALHRFERFHIHDHIVVWGEYFRDGLKMLSAGNARFHVTGCVKYEGDIGGAKSPAVNNGLKVLFLPSRTDGSFVSYPVAESIARAVIECAKQRPEYRFIIKPHPSDDSILWKRLDFPENVAFMNALSSIQLVRDSDVVIISTSSSGFEACAIGKDLIVTQFPGQPVSRDYQAAPCAIWADSAGGLLKALDDIHSDADIRLKLEKGRAEFRRKLLNDLQPGVANRNAGLLSSLLREKHWLTP